MPIDKYKIFDTLIEGVQVISPDWTYLYVNPASANQFKLKTSDLINKKAYDVFPNLKGTEIEISLQKSFDEGKSFDQKISFNFPNNKIRWYHIKLRPIEEGTLLMMNDITSEIESQQKLKQSESRIRRLFNTMHESYGLFELIFNEANEFIDLKFIAFNAATSKLIVKDKFDLTGKKWTKVAGQIDDYFKSKINITLKTGKPINFDVYLDRFGTWFSVTIHPMNDNQVAILGSNITTRKKYEKNLKEFNKKQGVFLEEKTKELSESLEREKALTELQSRFLSIAAHELKAPLSSINVCLDVLDKNSATSDDDNYKKYSSHIREETDSLMSMITHFISPTNKIINERKESSEPVSLNKLINKVLIGLGKMTSHKQNIVHIREGEDEVFINNDILKRILLNLLVNAIKYSANDIEIHTKIIDNQLTLSIKDQGIGIPPEQQKKIFDKYFRASNTKNIEGTGLGLGIVKNYVDILDGTLDFVSKENEGTAFNIRIPLTNSQ